MIKTVSSSRTRSQVKTIIAGTLPDAEAAYNSFEATKAADETKTYTVRVVNSYQDGANYVIVAEATYPEVSDNPTGQVPELSSPE